jgi:hypothetical protein
MTFEEHIADARKRMDLGRWPAPALICALEALAAERAAKPVATIKAELVAQNTATPSAYTRAMTAPRLGGQHPHDGRHIMSIGSWGMV